MRKGLRCSIDNSHRVLRLETKTNHSSAHELSARASPLHHWPRRNQEIHEWWSPASPDLRLSMLTPRGLIAVVTGINQARPGLGPAGIGAIINTPGAGAAAGGPPPPPALSVQLAATPARAPA